MRVRFPQHVRKNVPSLPGPGPAAPLSSAERVTLLKVVNKLAG
jgi:hypothetical protein